MLGTVVIPRLRRVLAERSLALDELHRRLLARGDAPSPATLARLCEEKPIRTIRVDTVLPVMEELAISLDVLFETVPRAEWQHRQRANRQAFATAGVLVRRRPDLRSRRAPVEAETEAVIARLEQELRANSPELFDDRGRFRKRALVARLAERFRGTDIQGDEIIRWINAAREARPGGSASQTVRRRRHATACLAFAIPATLGGADSASHHDMRGDHEQEQ